MRSPKPRVTLLVALLVGGVLLSPAHGEDDGVGPKGVLPWFQEFVHAPMAPHENPRDLTLFRFVRKTIPEAGAERIVTESPPGCGMTVFERLPRDEAIRRLRELFKLYGFPQRPDHVLALGGVAARLDGYDPGTRTGFVLVRGDLEPMGRQAPSYHPRAPLSADVELDLSEWKTLTRQGHRILRVPEDRFLGMPPTTFVQLLACLLDAADWLNAIAKRPDFDVEAFLGEPITTPVPDLEAAGLPLAQPLQQDERSIFAVLKASAPVTLDFASAAPRPPPTTRASFSRPALLLVAALQSGASRLRSCRPRLRTRATHDEDAAASPLLAATGLPAAADVRSLEAVSHPPGLARGADDAVPRPHDFRGVLTGARPASGRP